MPAMRIVSAPCFVGVLAIVLVAAGGRGLFQQRRYGGNSGVPCDGRGTVRAARSARAARAPIPATAVPARPVRRRATARAATSATASPVSARWAAPSTPARRARRIAQCRPPLHCALTGFFGACAEAARTTWAAPATPRRLPGRPLLRRRRRVRPADAGLSAVRRRDVQRRGPVPRLLRGPARRQTARRLLPAPVSERHPRHAPARSTSPTSRSRVRRRWASTWCSSTSTPGPPTSTASPPPPGSPFVSRTTSTTRPRPAMP